MTGDRMKMLMLTLPFMVQDLIAPEVKLINSAINNMARDCADCLMLLIPVLTWWTSSFSAWTGIWLLGSHVFHRTSLRSSMTRQWIYWTYSSKNCLIRQAKRAGGISKRHTAFCTRSAKSLCGAIPITHPVKHLRYVLVCTTTYEYVLVCTGISKYEIV